MVLKAQITVNETLIVEVDEDPSLSGVEAPLSSVAMIDNDSDGRMWIKTSALDTGWTEIPNRAQVTSLINEKTIFEQLIYVEKGGDDAIADGSLGSPFATIASALAFIADASPSKRYVVKVAPGTYSENSLKLKANIFIVGESRDSVRISSTATITLDSSFSGSADHRSGFQQCIVTTACDFDWSTVTSAAGKLYFNEVSFSSTVRMYGHNNASAQAQFNSCQFFAKLTVSGINVGSHTNCFHFSSVELLQHPNGGMATILNAAGGSVSSILIKTTVNNFNRRCSLFARNFFCDGMTVDGPSSYADATISSFPKAGATKLNGGNIIQMNDFSHGRLVPNESNAHNLGDWGKQWFWHFAYIHATSGTDMYIGTYPESYAADSAGKSVYIMPDLAGLLENANGGDVVLQTAAVSGTGVRGKVQIDARELDLSNIKITNLANGINLSDAVNKSQLDLKLDISLKGTANGVAELDAFGKVPASQLPSYVDDVVEYANFISFPAIGQAGIIYVAVDANKTYRWSGSIYVEISAGPATSDNVPEGTLNLYFTDTRAKNAAVINSIAGSQIDQAPSVFAVKSFILSASGLVVVENEASLPVSGEVTKLYITKDDDKLFYYKETLTPGGSTYEYKEISAPQPFEKEKIVITASHISNQYITLQHHARKDSIQAHAGRVAIHAEDDYTVSVVSNETRLTFVGDIAAGGASELEVDDVIYIYYTYPG